MGIHVLLRVADLGESLVLAPERFDPRRSMEVASERRLSDLAEVVTENVTGQSFSQERAVLVLDTTHAYEGFVVFRHDPVTPRAIGSAKRRLSPGDVIISRLRPYLRQIAYVDEDLFRLAPAGNDVCASTEFFVIRGRDGFDATALVPFLLSEPVQAALAAGQEGGHHPRFSKELLESIRVPDCVLNEGATTARGVRELASSVRRALVGCRALVATVERQMGDSSAT
jgi:hypothetical protein